MYARGWAPVIPRQQINLSQDSQECQPREVYFKEQRRQECHKCENLELRIKFLEDTIKLIIIAIIIMFILKRN